MTVLDKTYSTGKYVARYLVDEECDQMRLDQFLQIYLRSFSREAIKKKIFDGEVSIKNRPGQHRPSTRIHHNDIIKLVIHKKTQENEYWKGELIRPQLDPEIVFEDTDIIVISKPPFMTTHPTGRHIFNCATTYFETIHKRTIHSIHRLDRETSGILLLGKNPASAATLTDHFENSMVKKCYFFIAKIDPSHPSHSSHPSLFDLKDPESLKFTVNNRLETPSKEKGRERVYINSFPADSYQGKEALTHFKIVHIEKDKNDEGYAIGLAFPKTGRQHQIRVHAKIRGLPLIGDKLYLGGYKMFQRFKDRIASSNDHKLMQIPRHALHAMAINIPYQGKLRTFSTPLPQDLTKWMEDNLSISNTELLRQINKEIQNFF